MAFYKEVTSQPYTVIANELLQSPTMSLEAIGLTAFMQSLPAGWKYTREWLEKDRRIGKCKIKRILKEIEDEGYLTKKPTRDEKGRLTGYDWIVRAVKTPQATDNKASTGGMENGLPVKRAARKTPPINKTVKEKKKSSSKPEQAQADVKPSFEFDLVLAWLITQLEKLGNYLSDSDRVFVEASLHDYVDQARKPTKATAYSWVEQALTNRFNVMQRSHQSSEARNRRTKALVAVMDATSDNMTNKAEAARPKTVAEQLTDTSWADDDFFAELDNE